MSRTIRVLTPCRLHFGMFGFGHPDRPQFGGVGVMVEPPGVELTVRAADRFQVEGPLSDRAREFAERAIAKWSLAALPRCVVCVENTPPCHVGLGLGTQLGLAVIMGLGRFLGHESPTARQFADWSGRGGRSAVGTHGFLRGGLIVDGGKQGEGLGKLEQRLPLPEAWRFVLIRARNEQGISGTREREAFSRLPPVAPSTTETLHRIVDDQMLPALEAGDCQAFGQAVHAYGTRAGECFATIQGGLFASYEIAQLVSAIRAQGVPGVGQSSWGPTVFAIVPDETQAAALVDWVRGETGMTARDIRIARPNNRGALVEDI